MNDSSRTCRFCHTHVGIVAGSDICVQCVDYDIATSMALSILDANSVEEKGVRAAIAAEIVRDYLKRSRIQHALELD